MKTRQELLKKDVCYNCVNFINHFTVSEHMGIHSLCGGHCTKTLKYVHDTYTCKDYIKGVQKFKKVRDVTPLKEIYSISIKIQKLNKVLQLIKNKIETQSKIKK